MKRKKGWVITEKLKKKPLLGAISKFFFHLFLAKEKNSESVTWQDRAKMKTIKKE